MVVTSELNVSKAFVDCFEVVPPHQAVDLLLHHDVVIRRYTFMGL